jgi:ABC-type glycerol-3-phosphate transport system substrate-binding protein
LLGEYGRRNPGVRIELKLSHSHDFSSYLEQIDRDGSDIAFVLDSHLGERRGLLRPLSAAEAVESGAGLRNGVEGLFRYGARAYAWPLLFSTNVLICNPEHFERAGIGRPGHDWDMEEFDDCCVRLEAGNPGVSAFMMPLSVNRWFNFLLNGGVRLNALKGGMMPRVELGMFERESVRLGKRLKTMPGMLTEQQLLYALLKGRVSMICGSYMSTLDLLSRHDVGPDDFREFFLRVLPRDRMCTGMPVGAGIGISAGARNPNQAADFCRFAFSCDGQELIRESACGLPVLNCVEVATERELGGVRLKDYDAFRHYSDHVIVRPSRNDGDWERFEREMSLYWCGLRTIDEVRKSLEAGNARVGG